MSLEKVFFARNAQSTLKLGQARGVVLASVVYLPLLLVALVVHRRWQKDQ